MGFVVVPHWSAMCFIFPTVCVLYIDLIGTMQLIGLHINVISYIAIVVSIGLMVDFVMHIVLRYYELSVSLCCSSREDRVRESLRTMGASILLGGLSTCLSTFPLLFSTSNLAGTVSKTFFSMVTLSLAHGLILLPVVLSVIGPVDVAVGTLPSSTTSPISNLKVVDVVDDEETQQQKSLDS